MLYSWYSICTRSLALPKSTGAEFFYLQVYILKTFKVIVLFLFFLFFSTATCSAKSIVGFLIPSSGLGDQSFNDLTYAGLVQARTQHEFTLIREQCADFTEKSRLQSMQRLLSRGATIIVVNGWEYRHLVEKFAVLNPERIFLINDFPMDGFENVISTVFAQHEGSFLAGALAGWMTKSGKIGFIGGMDMPVIRSFQTGFNEGARFANPNIVILESFLSTPDEALSGFNNPALGFTTASRMYESGADIIFGPAGLSGSGIIQAARRHQKYVIGVDADQDYMAKGYVLTSVMKRLDKVIATILGRIYNNEKITGTYSFGLKEDGVSLTPMTYTKKQIPLEIQEKVAQLRQDIIDGRIHVTNILQMNNEETNQAE
jgi:basic membrane protein A